MTERARKPTHRRCRLLLLALGVCVVASGVGFVLWLRSAPFEDRARALLSMAVAQQTGERFDVDGVRVQFWPPAAELTGVRLWHEPTGDDIATVESLRAPLVLRDGTVGLGQLELREPRVTLHVDDDGLRELRHTLPGDGGGGAPRLPWHSLAVTDGALTVHHEDGLLEITDLHATPVDGPLTDVTGHVRVRVGALEDEADLDLRGVVLGPDRIEVPALALDSRTLHVSGSVSQILGGPLDARVAVATDLDDLAPLLPGPRAVHGTVDVDVIAAGQGADTHATLTVSARDLGLDLPSRSGGLVTYELGDLLSVADVSRERVTLRETRLAFADGLVTVDGTATLPDLTVDRLQVGLEGVRLEQILTALDAAPTPWVDLLADGEVQATGTLNPLHLTGPFELAVADLRVGNGPVSAPGTEWLLDIPRASARGALTLEKHHIALAAHEVRGPGTRGSADIDIGFGRRGPLDVVATLDPVDLSTFGPLADVGLQGTGRLEGRFHGPFDAIELQGSGEIRDFSVLGIPYADRIVTRLEAPPGMKVLRLVDARAVRGRTRYHGDWAMDFRDPIRMDTDVVVDEGRVEDLVGMFVDLEGLTGDLAGHVSLHGPLYDLDGDAALTLADVDLWGERFDVGSARGFMDEGLFTLDDLRVTRDGGREGLVLRGTVVRDWALDMELVGDGFRLDTMDWVAPAGLPLSGDVALAARLGNTLFEPEPRGRLTVSNVRYAGNPVDDSVLRFETDDGVMRYQGKAVGGTVAIRGTLGLWEDQPYELDAFFANFPAHFLYPEAADGGAVTATLSGSVGLQGRFGEAPTPVRVDARVEDVRIGWGHHTLTNPSPWRYYQQGTAFSLDRFALVGGGTDLRIDRFANTSGVVEVRGGGRVDLDLLRAVVPDLLRAEGTADVTMNVTGTGEDADALVEADVDATLVRHAAFPEAFEDVRAEISATGDHVDLTRVDAALGGGTVTASGRILTRDGTPTRYALSGHADDVQVQWVDYLPPAIGDARLSFDGPVDALLLSGDVAIHDMTFSERIDWEDWVVEFQDEMLVDDTPTDAEPWFSTNLHITADQTIHLRNNVAEGTASADLRVIGDTARPGLTGWVRIDDALAYLQDREFRVQRGHLTWRDPWTWDPDLDFDLVTDITSRERRYRVSYRVLGPFSDWRAETRSDPLMSQADVNALLWFGVTADELEESGDLYTALGQSALDFLLADVFVSGQLGGAEEARMLVDRIDIATGVNARGEYSPDPRLVVQKRLDELEDLELTVELNLARTDDIYTRAERRITDRFSLSGWYATRQRDAVGGAAGVDVRARWEFD